MKTPKLIKATIAILLFSNLLFSANPENIAGNMIAKISKDIVLTDSQKVVIQTKANEFVIKMQSANLLTNEEAKFASKKQASNEYKAILDSLLTNEQRKQLQIKIKIREDAN